MTTLEMYGVKRLYALHCKIVELLEKRQDTTVVQEQIKVLEEEIMDLHDALVQTN